MVRPHLFDDPEALIGSFFHLKGYTQEDRALDTLKRVASLVKPIMRKHGWRISKLAEFYPEMEPNLLGLNTSFPGTNRLPFIQVRLRQPFDSKVFMDYDAVVQTMLHELAHCKHGPHDDKFWKLFRSLQEELDTLKYSGYTGEGFLGKGQALGAAPRGLSQLESKRRAREAAERRRKSDRGRGRVLGTGTLGPIRWTIEDVGGGPSTLKPRDSVAGPSRSRPVAGRTATAPPVPPKPLSPFATPQQVAAEAALHRDWEKAKARTKNPPGRSVSIPISAVQGTPTEPTGVCPGVRQAPTEEIDREIAALNGFESVAEMENANEQAIMQAAIELLEEADREEAILKAKERQRSRSPVRDSRNNNNTHVDLTRHHNDRISRTQSAPVLPHPVSVPVKDPGWSCPVCTYVNQENHLQCSVCKVERYSHVVDDNETKAQIIALEDFENRQKGKPISSVSNRTETNRPNVWMRPNGSTSSVPMTSGKTWTCHGCARVVGHEWWTCGNCGTMKLTS